ncbi:MAG: NUDIX hydrolase N-terminal domain-containing protein [Chloroflexota bacterium]
MDIFTLLDSVRTIAQNGLHYAQDPFDRERYQHLMGLVVQNYSEMLAVPGDAVRAEFMKEIGQITPKIGADAAIFNENGEILLMERSDGRGWCLPCGFVEPGEKPSETVIREVREETGLDVAIQRLVGVFTRLPNAITGPSTILAVVHLCTVIGGELRLSHEGKALRYWAIEEMHDWHPNHDRYARAAHTMWQTESLIPAISD